MGFLSCCSSAPEVKVDDTHEEEHKRMQLKDAGVGKGMLGPRTSHASTVQEAEDDNELRITTKVFLPKTNSACSAEQQVGGEGAVNASTHRSFLQSQLKALSGAGLSASQIHVNWCQPSELVADVHELRWVGQGSQGVVYEGTWQGASVAVKWSIAEELDTGAYELLFSRLLGHPNVVQTYDAKVAVLDHQIMAEDSAPISPHKEESRCSSSVQQEQGSAELSRSDSFKSEEGFGNPYGRAASFRDVRCMLRLIGAKPGQCITQLIMEHCDQGSLLTAISRGIFIPTSRFGPKVALRALYRTAREVAQGMLHLHQSHVVHGDLKPANVLLMNSRKDRRGFVAKVSDFGLAQYCPASCVVENAPWGTLVFMAPERIRSKLLLPASDVWSFGVMLWQMYTAKLPYEGTKQAALLQGVVDGTLHLSWPAGSPPALMSLTAECMAPAPRQRPSFAGLVEKLASLENDVRMEGYRLSHSIEIQRKASGNSEMTRRSSRSCDLRSTQDGVGVVVDAAVGSAVVISPRNSAGCGGTQAAVASSANHGRAQYWGAVPSLSGPLGAQRARQGHVAVGGASQGQAPVNQTNGQWMRAALVQPNQQGVPQTHPTAGASVKPDGHPASIPHSVSSASRKWRGIVAGVSVQPATSSCGQMPSTPTQMPTTPQHGNLLSTTVSALGTTCSSSSLDWQSAAGSVTPRADGFRRNGLPYQEGVVATSPLGTSRAHMAVSSNLGGSCGNSFVKRPVGMQRASMPQLQTPSSLATVSSGPDTPGSPAVAAQEALVKLDTGLPAAGHSSDLSVDGMGSWKASCQDDHAGQRARHGSC